MTGTEIIAKREDEGCSIRFFAAGGRSYSYLLPVTMRLLRCPAMIGTEIIAKREDEGCSIRFFAAGGRSYSYLLPVTMRLTCCSAMTGTEKPDTRGYVRPDILPV